MTTAPVPLSHSLLFWGLHYGTRHFPMMVTLSSWNTWTWKNFSQRMASLPVQPSTTTALINQLFSNLPQPHHLSWTSATEHPHRSTWLWFPKTACKIQPGQVKLRGPVTFWHHWWGVPYICATQSLSHSGCEYVLSTGEKLDSVQGMGDWTCSLLFQVLALISFKMRVLTHVHQCWVLSKLTLSISPCFACTHLQWAAAVSQCLKTAHDIQITMQLLERAVVWCSG